MELVEDIVTVGHECGGGTISGEGQVDGDIGDDAAGVGVHDQDAGTHVDGLVNIVGDHDGQLLALTPDLQDLVLHVHAGKGVQCAQGLVQQQDAGLVDQGTDQGHTLGHTAGQLGGIIVPEVLQTDDLDHALDLVLIALELALHLQGEGDVLLNRQPGEQGGLLEHHAAVGGGAFHFHAVNGDLAGGGMDQAGHQTQDGGLAAAGGADQADELAGLHGGGHGRQCVGDIVIFNFREALGDFLQLQGNFLFFHHFSAPFCQRSAYFFTTSTPLVTTVKMKQMTNRAANILS